MKRVLLLALALGLFAATIGWRNIVMATTPAPWWLGIPGLALVILGCIVFVQACSRNVHRIESGEVIDHRSTAATPSTCWGLPNASAPASLSSHLPAAYELRLRDERGRTGWVRVSHLMILDEFPIGSYYPS